MKITGIMLEKCFHKWLLLAITFACHAESKINRGKTTGSENGSFVIVSGGTLTASIIPALSKDSYT